MDAAEGLSRRGRNSAAPPFTFRSLLGAGLRLPAVPGGGAVVMRSVVVEREALDAQRSGGTASGVELATQAVARADVLERRVAAGRDRPVVREGEAEIRLDRRRAAETETEIRERGAAAVDVRGRLEVGDRRRAGVETDALPLIREPAVVPGLRGRPRRWRRRRRGCGLGRGRRRRGGEDHGPPAVPRRPNGRRLPVRYPRRPAPALAPPRPPPRGAPPQSPVPRAPATPPA